MYMKNFNCVLCLFCAFHYVGWRKNHIEIDLEKNRWTGTITVHYSQPIQVLTGDRAGSEKVSDATKAYRFKWRWYCWRARILTRVTWSLHIARLQAEQKFRQPRKHYLSGCRGGCREILGEQFLRQGGVLHNSLHRSSIHPSDNCSHGRYLHP